MNIKINLRAISIIVSSSIILGIIFNIFSTDGIPFIRSPIVVKSVELGLNNNDSEAINGLNLAQVIELHSSGKAIFIDARDQWEYSDGHIPGSINIPEFSFTIDNKSLQTIEKNALIVVYCDGDECDISKRLAKKIIGLGYTNSYVYLGGFKEWKESNLQIEGNKQL